MITPFLCCALTLGALFLPQESTAKVRPSRCLDASFATWIKSTAERPSYREVTKRFLQAAKRDTTSYETGITELVSRWRVFAAKERAARAKQQSSDGKQKTGKVAPVTDVELLQGFFFREERFVANLDLKSLDNLFPDSILERRQGYCLGLSLVLLDFGERVGLPLSLVSAPRHTFVRVNGSPPANLETTLAGEVHSDDWYVDRFALGAESAKRLLRTLTPREAAAHLINNHGFALLEQGDFAAARQEFLSARELSPELVEASINLGVLLARQKKFEAALPHFARAQKGWPHDPYVQLNRANAISSLGRHREAAQIVTKLYRNYAPFEGLATSAHEIREALHPVREWSTLQELVLAINERTARSGKKPGLRATFYGDTRLEREVLSRVDKNISFRWNWNSPARGVGRDHFSARWHGWLEAPAADEYTFFVTCSDGVRIWINGRLILDAWTRTRENFSQGKVRLEPGLHDIRVEYFESNGEAGIAVILTAEKRAKALRLEDHIFHWAD